MNALQVDSFRKRYGKRVILDDLSFTVQDNETVGIIGHNGVGKTTLIESIIGLRSGYGGKIRIYDQDIKTHAKAVKFMVGAQLQECVINKAMRVYECVQMQAAAFGLKVDVNEQLKQFGLAEKKHAKFGNLSGGQQQRLFVLLSNIHNPKMLFFDEITTGLDPQARREVYKFIIDLKKQGKTVFFSTHIMDELSLLCDRVIILKNKKIFRNTKPDKLMDELPFKYVSTFNTDETISQVSNFLTQNEIVFTIKSSSVTERQYEVYLADDVSKEKMASVMDKQEQYTDFDIRKRNMDDVFKEFCTK